MAMNKRDAQFGTDSGPACERCGFHGWTYATAVHEHGTDVLATCASCWHEASFSSRYEMTDVKAIRGRHCDLVAAGAANCA
jgi:hypothetical protein